MKVLVVTSWSDVGFDLYGKRWLETYDQYWPKNCDKLVVTDDMLRIEDQFVDFMRRHQDKKLDPRIPGYDYRMDLLRFCHKIFALKVGLKAAKDYDYLIWLDGDVETRAEVTDDLLAKICPDDKDGALLSRADSAPHPECGFMSFNLRRKGKDFLERYINLYESDNILKLKEYHDSHAFMIMLVAHTKYADSVWEDLAPAGIGPHGLDAFEASVLNDYFVHKKGNRKSELSNAEILALLLQGKTAKIVRPNDPNIEDVDQEVIVLDCDMQPVELLHQVVPKLAGKRVIYRGWYSQDERGAHVDTTRFGINQVKTDLIAFESIELTKEGGFIHLAVDRDFPIPDGVTVFRQRELQAVSKQDMLAITNGAYQTNMLVKTQNCVADEQIIENIKQNLEIIKEWVKPTLPHRRRAVIVSAGPSLDLPETMEDIRKEVAAGAYLFCVKHSHKKLIDNGIKPDACVLLDPRPHEGISTHGEPRAVLLPKAVHGITYFCASMVDPGTIKRLIETGGRVVGWHAAVGANEASVLPDDHKKMLMGGGSSSAGRAMILSWQFLGFSSIGLYAFDSCHLDESKIDKNARHQDGTDKYFLMEVGAGKAKKQFWTDRDILCQAQDFSRFLNECPWIHWDAHGPGMVAWLWQNTKGNLPSFEDQYG